MENSSSKSEVDSGTFSDAPTPLIALGTLRFQLKPAPLLCMWELRLLFRALRPMFELSRIIFYLFWLISGFNPGPFVTPIPDLDTQ